MWAGAAALLCSVCGFMTVFAQKDYIIPGCSPGWAVSAAPGCIQRQTKAVLRLLLLVQAHFCSTPRVRIQGFLDSFFPVFLTSDSSFPSFIQKEVILMNNFSKQTVGMFPNSGFWYTFFYICHEGVDAWTVFLVIWIILEHFLQERRWMMSATSIGFLFLLGILHVCSGKSQEVSCFFLATFIC